MDITADLQGPAGVPQESLAPFTRKVTDKVIAIEATVAVLRGLHPCILMHIMHMHINGRLS